MKKKKKIIIGILILVLGGLLFFEGRRITFSIECISAETELQKNFEEKKFDFFELAKFTKNTSPLQFDFHSGDTIYMTFQDSSIYYVDFFIDSIYSIRPETKLEFLIDEDGCLGVVDSDTVKVCNNNWRVQFYGHYKDKRIDQLLSYYGWTRHDFESLVEQVQELNCDGFTNSKNHFGLNYKTVSYYNNDFLHCFGHGDGYFGYLYTTQPDSFYGLSSLKKLENNYYGIEGWNF
ncbi:MAG: hypothetical protein COA58_13520 [Bacteroidetes bacterium]|nr:MAG: hypothetical protein COA58_13520 [Bacteroidota bacterium]